MLLLLLASLLPLLLLLLQGDFVVEYMGLEPGKGTHRYAVLMFEQPGFQKIEPPAKRAYFQTKQVRIPGPADWASVPSAVLSVPVQ